MNLAKRNVSLCSKLVDIQNSLGDVKIGHDLSSKEWKKAVETAISDFPKQPWILQKH